jgi:hypothetical protein
MPAVSIKDLTSDYLFEARMRSPTDNAAQLQWLTDLYIAEAEDRSGAEITSTSFSGNAHAAQFRASTPEDRRHALRSAIESVEATIAGATAAQFSKPFGFKFLGTPADILG